MRDYSDGETMDTQDSGRGGRDVDRPYTYGYEAAENGINLAAIWSAVYRMRFWVGGIIAACFLLGLIVSLLSTKIYEAQASVQIDQEAAKVIGTEQSDTSTAVADADRFLQTQLDILRSRSLAEAVGESLNLFDDDKFLIEMGEPGTDEELSEQARNEERKDAVLAVLAENLAISLPVDSRVATISFTSPDEVTAAKVANSFVDNYIGNNLKRKFDTSSYARDFLRGQLQEAAAKLADSEQKALDYSRLRQIVDVSNAANSNDDSSGTLRSLNAATLVDLNAQLTKAYAARVAAQEQWEMARSSSLLDLVDVQRNVAIQRLLEQKATTQAELDDQLQRRKADHPEVKQLSAQIRALDKQINIIGGGIRTAIKQQYESTLAQENELKGLMSKIKSDTIDEQSESVQLGILKRATQTDRELYDLLLKRYNELNAEAGVQTNNVSVVDRAEPPKEPVRPNIPLNLLVSLLAGVMLAGAFVFIREQIFNTMRTPEDVARKLGTAPIGVVPDAGENLVVRDALADPKTPLSEAFASLRTTLMLSSSHGLPRSIMFTSSGQGEGKSTICFGVATALQRAGKSVVVIDLDLRRPRQHRYFNVPNNGGMSDLLTDNKTIDEVLLKDAETGIHVIPVGEIPPSPAELLSDTKLANVLQTLQERFDVVLVDSPPLLGLADAVLIGSAVEKTLFVIAAGKNHPQGVRRAVSRLTANKANVAGFVLSRFSAKDAGYGYGYGYGYDYDLYSYEHKDD